MERNRYDFLLSILGLLLIILLFFLMSFLAEEYESELINFIGKNYYGMAIYVFLHIFATVVAPVTFISLTPLAAKLWGVFITGILNYIAWMTSAVIVFFISRKFGKRVIAYFVSIEKLEKIEAKIPKKNVFLNIVLLRIFIPVDILSYAIGLLTRINFRTYFFASAIGIIPFSFIIAYAGGLSFKIQIIGVSIFTIFLLIGIIFSKSFRKKIKKRIEN